MSTPSSTNTTPATGCCTATINSTASRRWATGGVAAKTLGRKGRTTSRNAPKKIPGVLKAAEHPGASHHGEHGGRPEQADPQVGDRPGGGRRTGAERLAA